jgi:hypothetical protein
VTHYKPYKIPGHNIKQYIWISCQLPKGEKEMTICKTIRSVVREVDPYRLVPKWTVTVVDYWTPVRVDCRLA